MAAVTRQYLDVDCDGEGCRNQLSDYADRGWDPGDEADMIVEAVNDYDWTKTTDGKLLCPDCGLPDPAKPGDLCAEAHG